MQMQTARDELAAASRSLKRMESATNPDEYADAWQSFIHITANLWAKLRDRLHKEPGFGKWYDDWEKKRKSDREVYFFFLTRQVDSHQDWALTLRDEPRMTMKSTGSTHILAGVVTPTRVGFKIAGSPLLVEFTPARVALREIDIKGTKHQPPSQLARGANGFLHDAARRVLSFYEGLITDAEKTFSQES